MKQMLVACVVGLSLLIPAVATAGPLDEPPSSDFDWSPANPRPGDLVTFTSRSTKGGGFTCRYPNILSSHWEFRGTTTTSADGATATYAYEGPGPVSVSLTTTNDCGNSKTQTKVFPTMGSGYDPAAGAAARSTLEQYSCDAESIGLYQDSTSSFTAGGSATCYTANHPQPFTATLALSGDVSCSSSGTEPIVGVPDAANSDSTDEDSPFHQAVSFVGTITVTPPPVVGDPGSTGFSLSADDSADALPFSYSRGSLTLDSGQGGPAIVGYQGNFTSGTTGGTYCAPGGNRFTAQLTDATFTSTVTGNSMIDSTSPVSSSDTTTSEDPSGTAVGVGEDAVSAPVPQSASATESATDASASAGEAANPASESAPRFGGGFSTCYDYNVHERSGLSVTGYGKAVCEGPIYDIHIASCLEKYVGNDWRIVAGANSCAANSKVGPGTLYAKVGSGNCPVSLVRHSYRIHTTVQTVSVGKTIFRHGPPVAATRTRLNCPVN